MSKFLVCFELILTRRKENFDGDDNLFGGGMIEFVFTKQLKIYKKNENKTSR